MKKWLTVALAACLLASISGCAPSSIDKQNQVVQKKNDKKEKAIIPNYQISDQYYKTILPFKPGKAQGMVVQNLNTRYDIDEFETGLMRIAKQEFSPEKYLFQEGQYLSKKTIAAWLERKYTKKQLKEHGLKPSENLGLNPIDDEKGSIDERNKKSPIYLAHISEQDYLKQMDDNTVQLGGVVIGLALNSVHYYQKEEYGATYDLKIPHKQVEEQGKKIADEVAKRIRKIKGLENVPVFIALFEQASKDSVVPGHFFAYTTLGKGESTISHWEGLDEKYYLFPSDQADADHRDDNTYFLNFKEDVQKYFDNTTGVVGRAFYKDGQLNNLQIDISIQFNGEAEAIGFTQYVSGLILNHFPDYYPIEVNISSVEGPEALIVKKAKAKEPFVHIYGQ